MTDERKPLEGFASRRVRLTQISRDGLPLRFAADEGDRRAIAERLGVLSVEAMTADLVVAPWRRDGASLRGRLRAEVTQESVVSLEPVRQLIDEPVDLTFLPESVQPAVPQRTDAGEIEIDPEGEDPPDVLDGDAIDVVGALEEVLALAIDPYPRGANENFASDPASEPEEDRRPSPFARLAALKGDKTDG